MSADYVTQGEPSLVAAFVAEQIDVVWVMGRGLTISPLQEFSRSVTGNTVCGPVAAKKLREFLPVLTRFDGEFRRFPREKLQNWIGASAKDTGNSRCNFTRTVFGYKFWKYNIKSERENVLRFRIRDGAAAQLPPERTGIGVARGGKEEGVAWGTQIFLE